MSQSPIAIPPLVSLPNSTDTLWFRYPQRWEEPVVLYNDGLGLSTTFHQKVGGFGLGKYFTTLSGSWSLQQMTIHAPSEHTWGGTHLPLEIQLVHVGSKPALKPAVLSIGFSRGPIGVPNLFLDTLVAQGIPKRKGEEVRTNLYAGQALVFGDLLRGPLGSDFDAEFIEYTGSATQPPCSGARVFVRAEPIPADPVRLQEFFDSIRLSTAVTDGNYRIPQALNGRSVLRMKSKDSTGMETQEEFRLRALKSLQRSTPAPSVPLTVKDPDHEDAAKETDAVKRMYWYSNPTKEAADKAAAKASVANDLISNFNESMILDNADAVVSDMPDVVAATAELTTANAELTTAQKQLDLANRDLILAKQAKDYSEGRTNLTDAESNLLAAQEEVNSKQTVVDSAQTKVNTAEQELTNAQGDGHAEVYKAQQILKLTGGSIPVSGGLEPPVPTTYELPTGPFADPFSSHSAELRSRIVKGTLPRHLTQALGPNHRYIAGTVATGSTAEEVEVTPAPSGVEAPADEEPQTVEG
jgi:carbonic anhydrase